MLYCCFLSFTRCACCVAPQAVTTNPLRVKLWKNAAFEVEGYCVTAGADIKAERDVGGMMTEARVCPAAPADCSDEVSLLGYQCSPVFQQIVSVPEGTPLLLSPESKAACTSLQNSSLTCSHAAAIVAPPHLTTQCRPAAARARCLSCPCC